MGGSTAGDGAPRRPAPTLDASLRALGYAEFALTSPGALAEVAAAHRRRRAVATEPPLLVAAVARVDPGIDSAPEDLDPVVGPGATDPTAEALSDEPGGAAPVDPQRESRNGRALLDDIRFLDE